MKKVFTFLVLLFSVVVLFGCNNISTEKEFNKNVSLTEELSIMFKTAYKKSIEFKNLDIDDNDITILNYFGTIGQSHIVSIENNQLRLYPHDIQKEKVKNMEFRYDLKDKVYVINENTLYTPKQAYELKIINFDNLCLLFGLNTSGLDTFCEEEYNVVKKAMNLSKDGVYELKQYYGKFNDHVVARFNFLGGQAAAAFDETYFNLRFCYGYITGRLMVMKDNNAYTLEEAIKNNILSKQDIYDLFELHTDSEEISEDMIKFLLEKPYQLSLKYNDDFMEDVTFDSFALDKYYGKYDNNYIFLANTYNWINHTKTEATEEELEILKYGISSKILVINDGVLYTLNQAKNKEIISLEIIEKIEK